MTTSPRSLAMLLIASGLAFQVQAGVLVKGKLKQEGNSGALTQFYHGDNARIEFSTGPGKQDTNWLIYKGGSGTVAVVDPSRKSFLEVNEAQLKQFGGLLSSMASLRNQIGEAPITADEVKFVKEKGDQKVGRWNCTRFGIMARKKRSGSLCVVPIEKTGAKRQDFRALDGLSQSFSKLAPIVSQQGPLLGFGIHRILEFGYPVEVISFGPKGEILSKLQVESIEIKALDAALFTTPKGYERNDITSSLKQMMSNPASGK